MVLGSGVPSVPHARPVVSENDGCLCAKGADSNACPTRMVYDVVYARRQGSHTSRGLVTDGGIAVLLR